MKHVVVEWHGDGYWLDPRPYLSVLPSSARTCHRGREPSLRTPTTMTSLRTDA
jgi:hypothetical protein